MNSTLRHHILKTPQSDAEDERFRRVCSAQGQQRAPTVRKLISMFCDEYEALMGRTSSGVCMGSHRSASRVNTEGPRHGHFASGKRRVNKPAVHRAPLRETFGGAPLQLRV